MIQRRAYLHRNTKPIARRARVRKRRIGPRANLARECAALWSEKVREKNGGRCQMAGYDQIRCAGQLEAAHAFGKQARPAVRYERWAGIPLCHSHHDTYGNSAHFLVFLCGFWGAELYEERVRMSRWTRRKRDLRAVRRELQAA